jgi:hypothetical protein
VSLCDSNFCNAAGYATASFSVTFLAAATVFFFFFFI